MKGNHKCDDGPQSGCKEAEPNAHGHDGEVRVDATKAENAVTDEGDDDGGEDEQNVPSDPVNDVADEGGDEC